MKYPHKITKSSKIGVCAPSLGLRDGVLREMLDLATKKFEEAGNEIVFTKSVFKETHGRSASAKQRAKEFMELWKDEKIEMIISASGGDYMMEILPYIDFENIKNNKGKLFQGCSDNTILTFLLTVISDIATVYGKNFYEFGMNNWHQTIKDNYNFLLNKTNKVQSIDFVEKEDCLWKATKPPKEYNCNHRNEWIIKPNTNLNINGRIIGGCLDNLIIICGTKYDKVGEFIEKYKDDGIIWYIESCELSQTSQARGLWQLKSADWFKNAKLIILGRPINQDSVYEMDYRDNLYEQLRDLNIPIIFDCNIGHIQPTFYVYNGSMCNVKYENGKGTLEYFES